MCYAFCKTHIIPDFIVVEGCAKENSFLNNASPSPDMPLFEALQFVSKTLEIYGLSKETKIIAASEVHSAFDVLKLLALGADAISMRNCLTPGYKPYQKDGIYTTAFAQQTMERLRNEILNSTVNIMQAWGYIHIKDITLSSFFRSLDAIQKKEDNKYYGQAGRDIAEKENNRSSRKSYYEMNTGAEVFLN
ncbi:MAG: glutamate synthase-related protein, partial [Ginsengibacter sp.]